MSRATEFYADSLSSVQTTRSISGKEESDHNEGNADRNVVFVLALFAVCMNLMTIILTLLPKKFQLSRRIKNSTIQDNAASEENARKYTIVKESSNSSKLKTTLPSDSNASWIRDINFGCCVYQATLSHHSFRTKGRRIKKVSSTATSIDQDKSAGHEACCEPFNSITINTEHELVNTEPKQIIKRVRLTTENADFKSALSATIYLIRFLAISDMCFMLTELILVWFLRLTDTELPVFSKVKFNFECRLETMLSKLFCITSEWTLVIFGVERVLITIRPRELSCYRLRNCRASNCPGILPSLDKFKLKIGMGLFIALLFAIMCNYLWMIGETKIHKVWHENGFVPMPTLTCIVRSEFYNFYYKFMVYLEELAAFVLPHLCVTGCVLLIVLQYGVQSTQRRCACIHHTARTSNAEITDNWPNSDEPSTLERPILNTDARVLLFNMIFCLHALVRIGLSAPENWRRCLFLFARQYPSKQNSTMTQELNFSKFTVSSTITVMFLFWYACKMRYRNSEVITV
ncbi:hypothetical protein EG68_06055 [Paragonimus skrjabini miyazakii]|uniref:Uncharacterized protein n=1 Tax=Paragonimus skrjabini miyazakii TaxID=59628 RepID=A0A8S9YQR6_9TREM|nr:hypothetical protein EG68_06055 [Paragonimus skrjabini miyazakii]